MSMNLQKQIRDNGTDIQEYLKELNKWTRDLKQQSSSNIVSDNTSKEREKKIDDDDGKVDVLLRNEEVMQKGQLSRDNAKDMKSYYEAWEKLNVDDYDKDGYECKKAIIDATNHEHDEHHHLSPMIPCRIITSTAPQKQKVNIRKVAGRRSKLEYALGAKERGNAFYKKGQHKSALSEYRLGLTYLTDNIKDDDDEKELMVTLYNNISAVYCKLSEYPQALKAANDALQLDMTSSKSFYRRGYALTKMKRWRLAKRDFDKSMEYRNEYNNNEERELASTTHFKDIREFVNRQVEGQRLLERDEAIRIITNTQRKEHVGKLVKIFVKDVTNKEGSEVNRVDKSMVIDDDESSLSWKDDYDDVRCESSVMDRKTDTTYIPKAVRIRNAIISGHKKDHHHKDALKKAAFGVSHYP